MPSEQEKIEFSKVLAERLSSVSDRVDKITETVDEMRDNHLHHIELRLKEIETTLKISWKIIIKTTLDFLQNSLTCFKQ